MNRHEVYSPFIYDIEEYKDKKTGHFIIFVDTSEDQGGGPFCSDWLIYSKISS